MGPVAALLALDRTTLTAALKPLERSGLVRVSRAAADRRSRTLILTPKGHEVLLQALPAWQRMHKEIEQLIPDGNPEGFRIGLRALS